MKLVDLINDGYRIKAIPVVSVLNEEAFKNYRDDFDPAKIREILGKMLTATATYNVLDPNGKTLLTGADIGTLQRRLEEMDEPILAGAYKQIVFGNHTDDESKAELYLIANLREEFGLNPEANHLINSAFENFLKASDDDFKSAMAKLYSVFKTYRNVAKTTGDTEALKNLISLAESML